MLMHGLINNLEWYDYIYIDICRHGFNYYNLIFFFCRERTPTQYTRIQKIFPKRSKVQGGGGGQLQIFASNMNSTTN